MIITQLQRSQFPLYFIETYRYELGWSRFTVEPFVTREQAESHREAILKEYGHIPPEKTRVSEYTEDHWRQDLIEEVLKDPDALRRALSILRTETLVDLLK